MAFREKLSALLTVFRMNNVTLARGIGADPSIVSRWRTGDRVPVRLDRAARDISAFLSGAPILPLDLRQLEELAGHPCRSPEETEAAVFGWLTRPGEEPASRRPPPDAAELMRVFSEFFSGGESVPAGPLNLWPHVQKGLPSEHEVFFGNKGRRQAAINFMHAAQSATRPGDVYLSGWADTSWFGDQAEFAELWLRCMRMILQNGHRLRLLTPPMLSPNSLFSLLRLPLYHVGSCEMYTAAAQDSVIMMAGKGMGAVISFPESRETTLFFKTLNDTQFFDNMVSRIFKSGKPLLTTCAGQRELAERILSLENGEGDLFSASGTLGIHHVPREDVRAVLEKSLPPHEAGWRMDVIEKRREAQEFSLRRFNWVELIPGQVLDALSAGGTCRISAAQLMLDRDAVLSGDLLKSTLENILDKLRNRRRFHIAITEEPPLPLSVLYREGSGAIFCPDGPDGAPRAACVGASPVLEGLPKWFSDRSVEKSEAIRRIEAVIGRL